MYTSLEPCGTTVFNLSFEFLLFSWPNMRARNWSDFRLYFLCQFCFLV